MEHTDQALIDALGGTTEVAKLLGFDLKRGGVQRVHNWRVRGIPPAVKLQFPHIFLKPVKAKKVAASV